MASSITHRITGTALYFGTFLITAWIVALATNAEWYSVIETVISAWYGQVILFLWPHIGFEPKTASTVSVFIYLFAILGAAAIFAATTWL